MSFTPDSQEFEAYVPVYDVVPDTWEDAKGFITEQLKKLANAVNIREIGFFLDQELLSGKAFVPGVIAPGNQTAAQFRSVLRIVVPFGALVPGVNTKPHGITVDANFTLIQLFASATDRVALTAEPIPNGADTISMDNTNIYITVAKSWTVCYAICEYIQEL